MHALEFKVWFDDKMNLIMLHSHPGTSLCPMLNGYHNYVTQNEEETDKQDKQSKQKKVCVRMITKKQKQRSRDNIHLEIIVVANSILAHTDNNLCRFIVL